MHSKCHTEELHIQNNLKKYFAAETGVCMTSGYLSLAEREGLNRWVTSMYRCGRSHYPQQKNHVMDKQLYGWNISLPRCSLSLSPSLPNNSSMSAIFSKLEQQGNVTPRKQKVTAGFRGEGFVSGVKQGPPCGVVSCVSHEGALNRAGLADSLAYWLDQTSLAELSAALSSCVTALGLSERNQALDESLSLGTLVSFGHSLALSRWPQTMKPDPLTFNMFRHLNIGARFIGDADDKDRNRISGEKKEKGINQIGLMDPLSVSTPALSPLIATIIAVCMLHYSSACTAKSTRPRCKRWPAVLNGDELYVS
ncbi:hypothetical protein F2P81_004351 [Scophthalmus maximus]|uniref:Uncharacterized protein n=1 Tax=Scophthalmus maximus TaxID=52904 RepID=A0A6A4TID6_SCOMX|nr:hypothetical protein F2P81_004351 [Scophthalmus maximus]